MNHSLQILVADDEEIVHETLGDYLRASGHQVKEAHNGIVALKLIEASDYDLALVDLRMPEMDGMELLKRIQDLRPELSVVLITAHGTMETVIHALRQGAADFLTKPIKLLELDAVIEKSMRLRELRQNRDRLRDTIRGLQSLEVSAEHKDRLVGKSAATEMVREQIKQAVEASVNTVLITGETGTGKEVVARQIHRLAGTEDCPFIPVNCPALTESLVESELFGHTKGAFTGATADRRGYFELADGGTIFLDEIADLSPAIQAKLLRVLETRTLMRVGGSKEIRLELRIIAATNAALEKLVEAGKFRADLLYRLNVFPLRLLPLRERRDDILPLAEHFLSVISERRGRRFEGFSPEAVELLLGYDYPGNARELLNLVERASIICREPVIQDDHLSITMPDRQHLVESPISESDAETQQELILKALDETRWNRRKAAEVLGMPYSTLRFKMNKLGIS